MVGRVGLAAVATGRVALGRAMQVAAAAAGRSAAASSVVVTAWVAAAQTTGT